jgi:hypothetical protein
MSDLTLPLSTVAFEVNSASCVDNFSQYISGDFGNLADRHAIRLSVFNKFVDSALRGNNTQYKDGFTMAQSLTKGKNHKIGQAWLAGFQAVGDVNRYSPDQGEQGFNDGKGYSGKLSDQPELVKAIAKKAAELTGIFSAAFAAIYPIENPAAKTKEEKEKAKKESDAKREKAFLEMAKEKGFVSLSDPAIVNMADISPIKAAALINDLLPKLSSVMLSDLINACNIYMESACERESAEKNAAEEEREQAKQAAKQAAEQAKQAAANGLVSIDGASIDAAAHNGASGNKEHGRQKRPKLENA